MKFYLFVLSIIVFSCTPPESGGGEIMSTSENSGEEEVHEIENDIDEENEFEIAYTEVVSAKIGSYQEEALMVLKQQSKNSNGKIPITGYYFYVKNQKNLDLTGVFDPASNTYFLTESYKGKNTGYMEFKLGDGSKSFWSPESDRSDKQEMKAKHLTGGNPEEFTLELNGDKFVDEHEVPMYDMDTIYYQEVTNKFAYTIVNDEFFVFDLSVVCTNGHSGSVSGIAQMRGERAFFNIEDSDEWTKCSLEFDLSVENKVSVIEKSCPGYHGARAYFDWEFSK